MIRGGFARGKFPDLQTGLSHYASDFSIMCTNNFRHILTYLGRATDQIGQHFELKIPLMSPPGANSTQSDLRLARRHEASPDRLQLFQQGQHIEATQYVRFPPIAKTAFSFRVVAP